MHVCLCVMEMIIEDSGVLTPFKVNQSEMLTYWMETVVCEACVICVCIAQCVNQFAGIGNQSERLC